MTPRLRYLLICLALVAVISWPETNYYPQLSQGDHGRDLYAAQAVLRGELPFKDFWWVYGPIMPYYYALVYKLTGGTIASFLLGKWLLKLLCTAFFYLAATVFMPAFIACLAAIWFAQSQQDFFFTFNHIGGIAMELVLLFLLFSYINTRNMRLAWFSLIPVFIYGLIKINFGLAALTVLGVTVAGTDFFYKNPLTKEKKTFYLSLGGVLLSIGLIYWLLLKDLPFYAVRQCMPYFGDDQPHHHSIIETIPYYFMQHWLTLTHAFSNVITLFTATPANAPSFIVFLNRLGSTLSLMQHLILHAATLGALSLFISGKISEENKKKLLLGLGCLGIFFVLNFHEFLVSGVWYRTFWSLPFLFMFHFLMINTCAAFIPKIARGFIWAVFIAMLSFNGIVAFFATQAQKVPPRFLDGPYAKVFLGNEEPWTDTVNAVSGYLKENLKPGETFFALPYDDIYYYLLNQKSPTRQLIFFDHIHIPKEQEISIIQELEAKNVAYVLLSNRMMSSETGLGIFGKSYCTLLANYIGSKYTPAARQGGDWQSEPGWGNNHGVMILKRK